MVVIFRYDLYLHSARYHGCKKCEMYRLVCYFSLRLVLLNYGTEKVLFLRSLVLHVQDVRCFRSLNFSWAIVEEVLAR